LYRCEIAIKIDIIGTSNSYYSRDCLNCITSHWCKMHKYYVSRILSRLVALCTECCWNTRASLMFPLIKLALIFPQRKFDLGFSFLTLNIKYSGNLVANVFNIW